MIKTVSRVGLLAAAVSVFPGCMEYALIKALEEDSDEEVYDDVDYADSYDDSYADDEYVDDYYDDSYADDYAGQGALDVRAASLAGGMGDVRDFAEDDAVATGYDYGSYASVEVHAAAPSGAAMAILEVEGGLQNEELVDGAHFEFQNYEYSDTGLYMYVIGCSGPTEGSWYFDEQAQDLVVDVTMTPEGNMVVDFASTFSDGQTVVGSTELGALQAQ